MRSMRFVLPAVAAMVAFAPTSGHADPYKWCAQYGMREDMGTNCGFVTYAQCRAAISGVGGTCQPNPFYTGPAQKRPARKRERERY